MIDEIPKHICDLLEQAVGKSIDNFTLIKHEGNEKGTGYLGEIVFVSLHDKQTGKKHHLVVKQALSSGSLLSKDVMYGSYFNEIRFYTKVVPSFRKFQASYPKVKVFENVAACLATCLNAGEEKIVLENMKFKDYVLHPKTEVLNSKMYEYIFKTYGKFHALSYAMKHHDPEKFYELGNGFINVFKKLFGQASMESAITSILVEANGYLKEIEETKIYKKFEHYVQNGVQLYNNAITYKSPYEVITHGDCWSNNYMFKFNESKEIEDMKMLDFQMVKLSSPVLDLTYSFYSGAGKEELDNYEHFLRIYHETLRENLKEYDCDVEVLLPYEKLKQEWKEVNAFGIVMALFVFKSKHTVLSNETPNLADIIGDNVKSDGWKKMIKEDTETIKTRTIDILRHLYNNDLM